MRVVGEVADSVRVAAITVADAQQTARNFVEVLEAAGVWAESQRAKEDEKGDEKGEGPKKDEDSSASEDDEEKTPAKEREERCRLLLRLNTEVLELQRESRQIVSRSPALLEAVAGGEKHALFALVAEILDNGRAAVGRAWRRSVAEGNPSQSVAVVEETLDFFFAAAAWNKIAAPSSFEARSLRLASLVDSALLREMVQEDLLGFCGALIGTAASGGEDAPEARLIQRLQDAAVKLQTGFNYS